MVETVDWNVDGKKATNIEQYLAFVIEMKAKFPHHPKGYFYSSLEAFVLAHGRQFKPQSLPDGIRMGEEKLCYQNAFDLALCNSKYTYCEGFAVPRCVPMPIAHAWVVDKDGNVIDNTWKDGGVEYFGVPFKTNDVQKTILSKNSYGIIENWQQKFPLLKVKKWRGIKDWAKGVVGLNSV